MHCTSLKISLETKLNLECGLHCPTTPHPFDPLVNTNFLSFEEAKILHMHLARLMKQRKEKKEEKKTPHI